MKKKIIIGVLATSILAGSAFAYNNTNCNYGQGNGHGFKSSHNNNCAMMKKNKGMHGKHQRMYGKHQGMRFMKMFRQLNLTQDQQKEMQKIMQSSMQKRESMFSAFSANSFDKEKFIKHAMNKKENMIKLKAQTLEKAYKVLTDKQKSQLRVLMDLKEEKGFAFDRHCNGRR